MKVIMMMKRSCWIILAVLAAILLVAGCGQQVKNTTAPETTTPETTAGAVYRQLQDKVKYSIHPGDEGWVEYHDSDYYGQLAVPEDQLKGLSNQELFAAFVDYPALRGLSATTSGNGDLAETIRKQVLRYCDAMRVLYEREDSPQTLAEEYIRLTQKLKTRDEAAQTADSVNEPYAVRIVAYFFTDAAYYGRLDASLQDKLQEAAKAYSGGQGGISPH